MFSGENVEFDENLKNSELFSGQSWGVYFAQKSGAMGDLSGTAALRVCYIYYYKISIYK